MKEKVTAYFFVIVKSNAFHILIAMFYFDFRLCNNVLGQSTGTQCYKEVIDEKQKACSTPFFTAAILTFDSR